MAKRRRVRDASAPNKVVRPVGQTSVATGSMDTGKSAIRIRMYRVGFGDCFLLTLPTGGHNSHILIDCGVHSRGDLKTMPLIVEDIAKETHKQLALVIASHAHQDHVSGFATGKKLFEQFTVGEVWLPWTENPNDAVAVKLRQKRNALALALVQHFAAVGTSDGSAVNAAINAVGNADALNSLKNGINGGAVRYLKGGTSFMDTAGIKGLQTNVLGPPTDEKFLSLMNPPVGDRFFRLDDGRAVLANAIEPFDKGWNSVPAPLALSKRELKDLSTLLDQTHGLAFALDSVLNNTSVVALLSYRGKAMLFPGDAQYGNWQSWMETPEGTSILSHIDYLKIAHHGSHNGTPKSALEKTPAKAFAAHISTQNAPWPSIPFAGIIENLNEKASGYVRSDSIPVTGAPGAPKGPQYENSLNFTLGPFWSDYSLTLS